MLNTWRPRSPYSHTAYTKDYPAARPERKKAGGPTPRAASLENYHWQSHCHGLFELPIAA
jgi:hypothetical protein